MPGLLRPVTNWTDTSASDGSDPTSLETLSSICEQPFKRRSPFFTILIDIGSSGPGGSRDLLVQTNKLELVMVTGILEDQVDGSGLQTLVTGSKLIKKIRIT